MSLNLAATALRRTKPLLWNLPFVVVVGLKSENTEDTCVTVLKLRLDDDEDGPTPQFQQAAGWNPELTGFVRDYLRQAVEALELHGSGAYH
jgi:hypothetical protein